MLKSKYRSELGMISDILNILVDSGRNGIIISSIGRKANLSHYTAVEKCQKLTNVGLVKPTIIDNRHTFTITEEGIQFFQQMQKFLSTIQEIKIRY